MPREKPAFRETLDRLDAAFPGRETIMQKELAEYLGISPNTVRKYFKDCYNKHTRNYPKTKIAAYIAE